MDSSDNNQVTRYGPAEQAMTARIDGVTTETQRLRHLLEETQGTMGSTHSRIGNLERTTQEMQGHLAGLQTSAQQFENQVQTNFQSIHQQLKDLIDTVALGSRTGSQDAPEHTPDTSEASSNPRDSTLALPLAPVKPQLKLKELRIYKGERKDGACEQWCLDALTYLQGFEVMTGTAMTEAQKIEYLAQHFEDAALKWWTNLLLLAREGLSEHSKPSTVAQLFDLLQEAFGDIHSDERRRDRWERLTQTSSVREFANALLHHWIFLRPQPPEYEVLRRFQNGLRWEIRAKMEENHGDIKTLQAYINKADDIDRSLFRVKQLKKSLTSLDRTTNEKSLAKKPKGQNYGMSSPIPNPKTDPDGHRQWCIINKRCFTCSSKEHVASACPLRKPDKKPTQKPNRPYAKNASKKEQGKELHP